MNKKYQPKRTQIRRESEPFPWKYSFVVVVSGAIIFGGFLLAAKTHFSSVGFCMQNAELKKKIGELEAEKRRLTISKEVAMAPAEIKKAARRLGLVDASAINIAAINETQSNEVPTVALIRKTVDSKPVVKPKTESSKNDQRQAAAVRAEKNDRAGDGETRERRVSKTGK